MAVSRVCRKSLVFFVITVMSTNAQIRLKDVPDTIACQVDGISGTCIAAEKCPEAQKLMDQGILPPMCEFAPGLFDVPLVCCSKNISIPGNTAEVRPKIDIQVQSNKTGLILGTDNNDAGLEGTIKELETERDRSGNKTGTNKSNDISGSAVLFLGAVLTTLSFVSTY